MPLLTKPVRPAKTAEMIDIPQKGKTSVGSQDSEAAGRKKLVMELPCKGPRPCLWSEDQNGKLVIVS